MRTTSLFALLSGLCSVKYCVAELVSDQVLIVLSFDAFKPQYFDLGITPEMDLFRSSGAYASYMIPRFPTKTFVNHFSIGTGCNAGSHGVTANEVYDSKQGELHYSYELFHYNDSCVPIWTVNEQNGKHSGCMMWPGSNYAYHGQYCSHFRKLEENMSWVERMQIVISWIKHPRRPANLIMWYIEQPDSEGHAFSPSSQQMRNMIAQADHFVGDLQREIIRNGLADRVNLIIVSDHGMETVKISDVINLHDFLTPDTYKIVGTSPVLQVIPNEFHEKRVYDKLLSAAERPNSHFRIYTNKDVKKRWKVNNERRLGPILAVADPPYAFQDLTKLARWFEKTRNIPVRPDSLYGVHGYDNEHETMRAIFMVKGPMFKSGVILKPFDNIDTYDLFCMFLNFACPSSEGNKHVGKWYNLLTVERRRTVSNQMDGFFNAIKPIELRNHRKKRSSKRQVMEAKDIIIPTDRKAHRHNRRPSFFDVVEPIKRPTHRSKRSSSPHRQAKNVSPRINRHKRPQHRH